MPCKVYNCLKMLGTTSNVPSINTVSQFVKISKNFFEPKIKIFFHFHHLVAELSSLILVYSFGNFNSAHEDDCFEKWKRFTLCSDDLYHQI